MSDLRDNLQRLEKLRIEIARGMASLKVAIQNNRVTESDLVDASYYLDRIHTITDEVRKESSSLKDTVDGIACVLYTMRCINLETPPTHIEGSVARGIPDVRATVVLPTRGSVEYLALLNALYTDEGAKASDVLRPHWPALMDYISARASQGLPTLPGIDPATLNTKGRITHLRLRKGVGTSHG